MKGAIEVFKKEFIDNLRDKRSVSTSLITPLITPLLLVALIIVLGRSIFVDPQETALRLPVSGAENAPALIAFLRQNNVEIVDAPADPEAAVREGNENVVLVIPTDFGETLAEGRPAPLQVVADSSRQTAIGDVSRAQGLLQQYDRTLVVLRLQARGVDPNLLMALNVQSRDVATPQSQTIIFLNMLPFLLIMTIFSGGMYVIIDTTAGERERGSMEPLLINPVPRSQLVLGKLVASLPFALASLAVTLLLLYAAFAYVPFEDIIGMPMGISFSSIVKFFLLSLPMLLFASAVQMVVATFTRSFKEAQTYLGFLPLIAGLPSMFLAFTSAKPNLTTMLIPTYGQAVLVNQIMRGETVQMQNVIISTIATLIFTVVLVIAAIRTYQRERILTGR